MNFENKYLIRWGIPGWLYLAVLITYFSLNDFEQVKSFIFSKDVPIIVVSITLFIGSGVILGHIIHQISLYLGFVFWTNQNKYFSKEYEMDLTIIKNKYGGNVQRIYSYRLGNIHALRALWFSLLLSLLTLLSLSITINFSFKIGVLIAVVIVINLIVFNNFIYFQSNLNYFIKKIRTDFKEEE